MKTFVSESEAETFDIGCRLGEELQTDDVLLIAGPLGAGKTAFVRGIAAGLGCDPNSVSSPTFTIVQEYRGRITVQHADLYRLEPSEVPDLGLDDLVGGAVLAVEWPDRWTDPPAGARRISIADEGGSRRRITIE